ncbi:MAG: Permease of the drug/metabolite transporter superfamily [Hydrocarboniphaga sp.]|uniref:DMT family transporter n=1 Tax=Hydrocarboniphaga sp. TaxID=2033016 RepID=UPI00261687E4|nr:DMT family transporter [Hydrocarboniphaga sp.]MDB5969007.1 Permease of the drug/metabolite transporter superfamily [Hydrocarboniphaga sp.]
MKTDRNSAALHAILGAAAFSVTGACIKAAAVWANNEQIVFFRSLINFLVLLPWALNTGRSGLATQRLGGHLWRSGLGLAAMYCFFYAIPRLPLAEAMLLNYSSPLYLPFAAWLWIREKPSSSALLASLLGLAGIALIVKPGAGGLASTAALVGWLSGLLAATAMVSIRRISDTEPTLRIVFYFAACSSALSLMPMLWFWTPLPRAAWLPLLGAGLAATAGQLALTRAYSLAAAALVGPFTYTCVLFSALLAWIVWGESLDRLSIAGGLVVIGSCILVSLRRREPRLDE